MTPVRVVLYASPFLEDIRKFIRTVVEQGEEMELRRELEKGSLDKFTERLKREISEMVLLEENDVLQGKS